MRIFLYKCIMELKNVCVMCAFLTKIMRDFPFLCANCALRGPNIITADQQDHSLLIVNSNTVYSGYSGHFYSGHSDRVATFPGTKYIYTVTAMDTVSMNRPIMHNLVLKDRTFKILMAESALVVLNPSDK